MNINYEKVEIKLGDVVEYEGSYFMIVFDTNEQVYNLLDLNNFEIVDWIAHETIESFTDALNLKFVESHLTIKR